MFEWYKLFSLTEFVATGLVARSLILNLESRGVTRFELTVGNEVSVRYLDTFLPVEFLDMNPYTKNGYAVYKDADDYVWFGFPTT